MARVITLGFKNINNYYLQNKADMKDKQIQSFLIKWIYLRNLLRWVMGMTPAVWFSGIPVSVYKPCCAITNQSTDLTTQHMNNKINCAYFFIYFRHQLFKNMDNTDNQFRQTDIKHNYYNYMFRNSVIYSVT